MGQSFLAVGGGAAGWGGPLYDSMRQELPPPLVHGQTNMTEKITFAPPSDADGKSHITDTGRTKKHFLSNYATEKYLRCAQVFPVCAEQRVMTQGRVMSLQYYLYFVLIRT